MPFKYISRIIDNPDPVIITPYGGYANDTEIHAFARVLEDEGVQFSEEDSLIRNVWNSYKRFASDEKHDARVMVQWEGPSLELRSDEEGYVRLDTHHGLTLSHEETLWLPLTFTLMEEGRVIHTTTSQVMKPSPTAEFAVISDMDDTILQTGVDSTFKWRVLVNSLLKNSHRRAPMQGSRTFYKALSKGSTGFASNPFFYISNSPWNIHDYLTAFLVANEFPKGVLLLRDIGFENPRLQSFMEGTKFQRIVHILETYPEQDFVLIGDAGELDADIYIKIAQDFPNRIKAIFIRSLRRLKHTKRVEELVEGTTHIDVFVFQKTVDALDHARELGLVPKE